MATTSKRFLTKEALFQEYIKTHPKSAKLHERALKLFAGSGATHGARIMDPFRPYAVKASGSRKWDIDGHEYIDYVTGHGALILGHSNPAWVKAIQDQAAKGAHFGENHELEIEWAELIKSMVPSVERLEFGACGQESNLLAIRLARLFTGRKKILRFEENFHGWADELIVETAPGIANAEVKVIPMHDLNILEKELATKQYAIVMTEGGGAHMAGQIPWDKNFIKDLAGLAKKYGTIWLLDEVVTGFREDKGGWQALLEVKPDLTTFGKCSSGGLAVGIITGRADVFEGFNPKTPPERRFRHTGTWNATPILCAAGIAACKQYLSNEPQKKAREAASYLREQGNKVLKSKGINGRLYGRTIVHVYLGPIEFEPSGEILPPTKDVKKIVDPATTPIKTLLGLHLLHRGVATMGGRVFIMSAVHSKKDIDQTIDALSASLDDMLAEGTFTSI